MANTNSKAKKITLEDFIAKASSKYKNRKMETEIEIKGYGLVPFNRPSDNDLVEYTNQLMKAIKANKDGELLETNYALINEASAELIFKSCPFLHNKDLQESLEVEDPLDTPAKAFGVSNLEDIAGKITVAFEEGKAKVKETIKN